MFSWEGILKTENEPTKTNDPPPKIFLIYEKAMTVYLIFNVFLSIELVLKLVDSSLNKKLKYTKISELI